MNSIVVLGEGAWASAIGQLLALNGHRVTLWCYYPEVARELQTNRTNSWYMPDVTFSELINATHSISDALQAAELVFLAIPVQYIRRVLEHAKPYVSNRQRWVSLSKGIEQQSLLFPTDLITQILQLSTAPAVISGPTFAREVIACKPTIGVLAAQDIHCANQIYELCHNDWFTLETTTDFSGVQICGAFKNSIALAMGMLEGAGYAQNIRASLLTHGLTEMGTLVSALGGMRDTVYGLAGVGDLMLTAYGNLSKNVTVGRLIGAGTSVHEVLATTRMVPEGINTIRAMHQLQKQKSLSLPVSTLIYEVVSGTKTVAQMVSALLAMS